ncbi:MAG: metal-dependent hydrolase [Balneolaceae bacterium]
MTCRNEQVNRDGFLLFGICCLAVWSHPFLDWLNTYGIRLLMPFSDQWFYGDVLFIIDPWMWLILASGVVLARSSSRPSQLAWGLLGLVATILVTSSERVPPAASWFWVAGIAGILGLRFSNRFRNRSRTLSRLSLALSGLYLVLMISGSHLTSVHLSTYFEEQEVKIESERTQNGWIVWLKDLRYVDPGHRGNHQGIGQVVVELDRELNPVRVR